MEPPRRTAATRAVLDALLDFDLLNGTFGRALIAATGLAGGTVYPMLAKLAALGVVESYEEQIDPREAGRPRRTYWRLTQDGASWARADLKHRQIDRERARRLIAKNQPLWGGSS